MAHNQNRQSPTLFQRVASPAGDTFTPHGKRVVTKTSVLFGFFKGTITASLLNFLVSDTGANIAFWQQLAIVVVGGVITAIGVVVGAYVGAAQAKENRMILQEHTQRLQEIAERGQQRREGDAPGGVEK